MGNTKCPVTSQHCSEGKEKETEGRERERERGGGAINQSFPI